MHKYLQLQKVEFQQSIPFSIQYLIPGIGNCLSDLHKLFPVSGFHFDVKKTTDNVGVFTAGIVAVAVPLLGRDSFQEVDITGITQSIVKHNFAVSDLWAQWISTTLQHFLGKRIF